MAITITGNDGFYTVGTSQEETGAPPLLVQGNHNTIVVGYYSLRVSGDGPAVVLTGTDNYLRFDNSIVVSSGPVTVQGSAGADTVFNNGGVLPGQVLLGGGNDYFQSNYGSKNGTVFGGDGDDALTTYQGTAAVDYRGEAGNDFLQGGSAADLLYGGTGDDSLVGNDGADLLDAGTGHDRLNGGGGNDKLVGAGNDDIAVYAGFRAEYAVKMSGGSGTIQDLHVDANDPVSGGDEGTDTITGVPILRFLDELIDTRRKVSELAVTTQGATVTNATDRYGYHAADISAAGVTFTNTAKIEGTATPHTEPTPSGYRSVDTGALTVQANGVTVVNRAGASIVGIDDALGTIQHYVEHPDGNYPQVNELTVSNAGTIRSTEGRAIRSDATLTLTNTATGVIDGDFIGVISANAGATITNAGTIHGGYAAIQASYLQLDNSGTIDGTISSGSYTSIIHNTGTIDGGYQALGGIRLTNEGTSQGDLVIDTYYPGYYLSFGRDYLMATVVNSGRFTGTIEIGGTAEFLEGRDAPGTSYSTITNSGTITGDVISHPVLEKLSDGSYPGLLFAEAVTNSGTIDGRIDLGDGNDSVVNAGTITGGVLLGAGDDRVSVGQAIGGAIDGGAGTDAIDWSGGGRTGGSFDLAAGVATIAGQAHAMTGFEMLTGTDGNDLIAGSGGAETLNGGAGDDTIRGQGGNDTLAPGMGRNEIDGGAGTDTLVLTGTRASYTVIKANGQTYLAGAGQLDHVTGVEQVRFADGTVSYADAVAGAKAFDALGYIASYADLRAAFGTDTAGATRHFLEHGASEGRAVSFDALTYIASYADLRGAFGANAAAGTLHYIQHGAAEGRVASFDALAYIASYGDLRAAFGANASAGAQHYINYGAGEGRTTTFDALRYIASYDDLIATFGTDTKAAERHFIQYGANEGRTASFDPLIYGATNTDLARAIGDNPKALTLHYIQQGHAENRVSVGPFDATAYLLSNADLQAARLGSDGALHHWLRNGANEGRAGDTSFGREQTDHTLSSAVGTLGSFDFKGDHDWFQFAATSGQRIEVDFQSNVDGLLELHRADGSLVATSHAGPNAHDQVLTFTADANDGYYLAVAGGVPSVTGGYRLDLHLI